MHGGCAATDARLLVLQVPNDGWRAVYALQSPAQAIEPAALARLLDGLAQTPRAILTRAAADTDPAAREAELLELVAQLPSSWPAPHDEDVLPHAAARCVLRAHSACAAPHKRFS